MNPHNNLPVEKIIELIEEFEFYNCVTEYIYKQKGKVVYRYSKHLTKWILELDKNAINMNHSKFKKDLSAIELKNITNKLLK